MGKFPGWWPAPIPRGAAGNCPPLNSRLHSDLRGPINPRDRPPAHARMGYKTALMSAPTSTLQLWGVIFLCRYFLISPMNMRTVIHLTLTGPRINPMLSSGSITMCHFRQALNSHTSLSTLDGTHLPRIFLSRAERAL